MTLACLDRDYRLVRLIKWGRWKSEDWIVKQMTAEWTYGVRSLTFWRILQIKNKKVKKSSFWQEGSDLFLLSWIKETRLWQQGRSSLFIFLILGMYCRLFLMGSFCHVWLVSLSQCLVLLFCFLTTAQFASFDHAAAEAPWLPSRDAHRLPSYNLPTDYLGRVFN